MPVLLAGNWVYLTQPSLIQVVNIIHKLIYAMYRATNPSLFPLVKCNVLNPLSLFASCSLVDTFLQAWLHQTWPNIWLMMYLLVDLEAQCWDVISNWGSRGVCFIIFLLLLVSHDNYLGFEWCPGIVCVNRFTSCYPLCRALTLFSGSMLC